MVMDRAVSEQALGLLAATAPEADADGYVELQATPFRGHHLLAAAALGATKPGDRVFEGGVSSGYFAEVLTRAGRKVDGFELDPVAAEAARRVCGTVHVGDLSTYDLDEIDDGYELLLFGDTLEHLPDPPAVLAKLRSKLTPTGKLIFSIPNIANWSIRASLLAGRFRYTDRGILDRTHLRFYTKATLPDMLADAGFRQDDLVGSIPVPGVTNPKAAELFHRIGNLAPGLFAYGFVVTASQA